MTAFVWNEIPYESMDDIGSNTLELIRRSPAQAHAFVAAYAVWIALNKPEYGLDAVRIAHENIESWVLRLDDAMSYSWYRNEFLPAWRVAELQEEN